MIYWNLHKNFQPPSAMRLRDFDLQSEPTLMGGEPINCRALSLFLHKTMYGCFTNVFYPIKWLS